MMSAFGNYAYYYDLMYYNKSYTNEAIYIHKLLQNYAPQTDSILELGCGTGQHALFLAQEGYNVYGVDLSETMLSQAYERISSLPSELASKLVFTQGDIRTVRLNQKFDAIISLFYVLSYQTTNADLKATFTTVKAHLKPGGVFIFDFWYGPAVLSDHPNVRVKKREDGTNSIICIIEPTIYTNQNLVEINYLLFIKDKTTKAIRELQESHKMRYLFKPELDLLFNEFKLEIIEFSEWLTKREPGLDSWSVYCVVKG